MWNDRRDRKLPSAIFRRQSVRQAKSTPNNNPTNKIRVHPQPNVPRPTFTGAQDWVQRHRGDIDTVVQLLDIYPNLIQSEGLDPLWNFLQPVLNNKGTTSKEPDTKEGGRTRKKSKGKGHAPNRRETFSRSFPDKLNARYVYVCDVHNSSDLVHTKSAKERIVTALSSYCYVRANPELPVSQTDLMDVLNTVSSADAFLFLMNDKSVGSWFCLHQLGIAIAYRIPIIAVREAGYHLPATLPSEFSRLEIVKAPVDEPTSPKLKQHVRSKSSETWPESHAKSESQSSGFHSDSENVHCHQNADKPVYALSDVIRDCFQTSVVYVPNFHDSCIAKLFGRLSDYLGDIFLDAEISKTEKRQRVRDSQSTDSDASDRLPDVKGSSVFRTLSHHHSSNEKETERTPSSDGSHDPPDTPTSTEKSSATPSSSPVKFPPIVPVSEVPETPMPRKNPGDVKRSARTKQNCKNTNTVSRRTVQIPDPTKFFISPPSSPFMETRYLVFPGNNVGASSKKPYLVSFPNDVFDDLDEKTDDKEEDELKSIQMTDEPTFDTIKLDVRLKQDVINDKSPFSTPLPTVTQHPLSGSTTTTNDSARRPRKDGRKVAKDHSLSSSSSSGDMPRPPKAAERRDRFHIRNGMIRGIQLAEQNKQAQITHPARKYIRNDPGRWIPSDTFGKKNIKMAKVTLQYGPNGKLPNPLI